MVMAAMVRRVLPGHDGVAYGLGGRCSSSSPRNFGVVEWTWSAGPLPGSGRGELPAAGVPAQVEYGQAGEVDRGGQQLEVLADPDQATHAGTAAAVATTQQVGQLALHLGAGGPVVGQPVRGALAGAGDQQLGLLRVDADRAASRAAGAGVMERADAAGAAEPSTPAVPGGDDRDGDLGRAGDRALGQVDPKRGLGVAPAGRRRHGDLDPGLDADGG